MPDPPPNTKYMSITTGARFETGCIATFNDGTTRHFVGVNSEATRAAADYCDAKGVKIVSLSTPSTIHRDLQGTRKSLESSGARTNKSDNRISFPEQFMLGKIGLLDLLDLHSSARSGARMSAESR